VTRSNRVLILLFAVVLDGACSVDAPNAAVVVKRTESSDTMEVLSIGTPEVFRVDSIAVLWQSSDLANAGRMAIVGPNLVIADRDRLHIVPTSGATPWSVGRAGEGPGEFRLIWGVGDFGGDSIAVYDAVLRRLTILTPQGAYTRSTRLTLPEPYMEARVESNVLVRSGDGVVMVLSTHMDSRLEVSDRAALVWIDVNADTNKVARVLDDHHFMSIPNTRYLVSRSMYPYSRLIAVSKAGVLAHADGMEYCFYIEHPLENEQRSSKSCRRWLRAPIGSGAKNPDLEGFADDKALLAGLKKQAVPESMPSFDDLQFGSDGRVWVRTVGAELADIHPVVLRWFPERGPSQRSWDVFGDDGGLVGTLVLPRTFEPKAFSAARVFGRYELASGELAVGVVELPAPLRGRLRRLSEAGSRF
jgi:hypothetical protein